MQTPWGEFPVRDAHVHFFSHGFFAALAAQSGKPMEALGEILGWELPSPDPEALAGRWVRELDRHQLQGACLIATLHGDDPSVAAAVKLHPRRFHGYFMLNPLEHDAAGRVRTALDSGLRGVCLFPAMHRYGIQDERVRPVLEAVAGAPGVIVFVHCGVLTVGVRRKLGLPSLFDLRFSNPVDLHAVALRYPHVNFVIPHFGAGYFREALMVCDLCPNVYLDTSSTNKWMRYLHESINLKTVFKRALEVAGASRLVFGTDSSFFPRGWNREILDAQMHALRELGTSENDARLIFGGNLERLLGGS